MSMNQLTRLGRWKVSDNSYLAHYGMKGQKHGERRWQNKDGSLTPAGRLHYGVGAARSAIGKVKNSVRKRIAPTNAELNAQIRKQRSKNLNKQKREQLKQLKKGIDPEAQSKGDHSNKGQHKKFSEMSDADIDKRINRLKNEITLAELEATKNLTPGKRMAYEILKEGGKKGLTSLVESTITSQGKKAIEAAFDSASSHEEKKNEYESELAERKAKKALEDYRKENPEGIARVIKRSREAAADRKKKKEKSTNSGSSNNTSKSEGSSSKSSERSSSSSGSSSNRGSGSPKSSKTSGTSKRDEAVEADSYEIPRKKKKKSSTKKERTVRAKVYRTWDAGPSSTTALARRTNAIARR